MIMMDDVAVCFNSSAKNGRCESGRSASPNVVEVLSCGTGTGFDTPRTFREGASGTFRTSPVICSMSWMLALTIGVDAWEAGCCASSRASGEREATPVSATDRGRHAAFGRE